MEAKAIAKYVRMSPSKLKPIADLVRGKSLDEALTILKFTPGKGSEIFEKVVLSAAANAENNHDMDKDKLLPSDYDDVSYPLTKLGWELGTEINPIMYTKKEWEASRITPFYHNVEQDAIVL